MNRLSQFLFLALLIFVFTGFSGRPVAPDPAPKTTIFQHLYKEGHLDLILESDFRQLVRKKFTNDYQPAKLTVQKEGGKNEVWNLEIRPRGKMRRTVCDIPPIKIRFLEDELESQGLDTRRSLKMVLICRNSDGYEQLLLREYLAYRLYNLLTNRSYRVQLAKIKYIDSNGSSAPNESFAFLIEHSKDLADRLNAVVLEEGKLSSSTMKTDEAELFAMFQFMIGNTDWHFFNSHNVDMLGIAGTASVIPIPYDFDYSGLVKAPYAVPHDILKLSHVTERYYQGYCRERGDTEKVLNLFLEKKDSIMQLATDFPHSKKYSQKYMCKYLGSFFKIIENPKACKRHIWEHCDLWPVH